MKKKDKTCLVITSYCSNDDKINELERNIKLIKDNLNIDILLHSNRITLNKEIQKKVNYYIYDSRYLILDIKNSIIWMKSKKYKMNILRLEIGYSVIEQIKTTSSYLLSLGYENVIFYNYDLDLDNFDDINDFLSDDFKYDALLFKGNVDNTFLESTLVMFNIKKFYDHFNINSDEYLNTKTSNMVGKYEEFLYTIFTNKNNVKIINKINKTTKDYYFKFVEFSVDKKVFLYSENKKLSLYFNICNTDNDFDLIIKYNGNTEKVTKFKDIDIINTNIDIIDKNVDIEIIYDNEIFNCNLNLNDYYIEKLEKIN